MEPRVITHISPDLTAASVSNPSRDAILIAPFLYKDSGISDGDGVTTSFLVTRNHLLLTGMKVFVDDVEYEYSATTPDPDTYNVTNYGQDDVKASINFAVAPASGAKIVAWYMHDQDDDGNSVQNQAFEIIPRRSVDYVSLFGPVSKYNPFMMCMNIARQYGIQRFYYIPVPYEESDLSAATPTPVDLTDSLAAASYITASVVCHTFSDLSASQLLATHCDLLSSDEKGEYRVGIVTNSQITLATQKAELESIDTERMAVINTPNGNVMFTLGNEELTKPAGYFAWACACRALSFSNIAATLTRQTIAGFKLTGKYLRDEREELNDVGGFTVKTVGLNSVQVAWAKTSTDSGLAEEEELSVVMTQDYVRAFLETYLDRRFISKIFGIPREFNGYDENDIVSFATNLMIYAKRNGWVVNFKDIAFVQDGTEPRRMVGSMGVKWPFPTLWIDLTISSYT